MLLVGMAEVCTLVSAVAVAINPAAFCLFYQFQS